MAKDASIQCPNPFCKAPNPDDHVFCDRCQTFIPQHYLWATGGGAEHLAVGTLVADRYRVLAPQVLLDTTPGLLPDLPLEISLKLETYLRLLAHRPRTPQVYGIIRNHDTEPIILLEEGGVYGAHTLSTTGESLAGCVMPELIERWETASHLQQVNWILQLAELWKPLSLVKASATLLQPELIRINGGMVHLLEVLYQPNLEVTLPHLGEFWRELADTSANPKFWISLSDRLIQKEISEFDQLINLLDHEISQTSQSGGRVFITTQTDQGPNRQRNEDSCYPVPGTFTELPLTNSAQSLVLVCDGIGGHEGGNVASNLAIETALETVSKKTISSFDGARRALAKAIRQANDAICARNDQEERTERQRMGTTIVAGLIYGNQLCIAHIGDSRAYRITRQGCYQVTIDDDIASRDVRQGYTLYREAIQHSSSGALTQALGMVPSSLLYPHTKRFVFDEDCIYLLCSDGLSDFDRIEEAWALELLPVLDGKADLTEACQRLLEIANVRNGHDNVTIALLQYQAANQPITEPLTQPPKAESIADQDTAELRSTRVSSRLRTRLVKPSSPSPRPWVLWFLFLSLTLSAVGVAWVLLGGNTGLFSRSSSAPRPDSSLREFSLGQLIKVKPDARSPQGLSLLPQPTKQTAGGIPLKVGEVGAGSILQVLQVETSSDASVEPWVKLKLCSGPGTPNPTSSGSPSPSTSPSPTAKASPASIAPSQQPPSQTSAPAPPAESVLAGVEGWQQAGLLSRATESLPVMPNASIGACTLPPSSPLPPSPQ
ncbi:protein phosphatase 2C domain-containing protein [Alkalinema sp. FACHB-956]|uniref:protein phosphatase 2C domain-containing protein n=1 Tax=Alkalinema sp. FACHB-956 TaxID=2692768 RepID=UPI0016898372|nr:protein phosphatase 2C domain-containing protein [Alkalinema sp. FACHB-956]MBD2326913.1 protein phosphatase 2C domain-containing protein [Alkalinema sp. FACHB-956]